MFNASADARSHPEGDCDGDKDGDSEVDNLFHVLVDESS